MERQGFIQKELPEATRHSAQSRSGSVVMVVLSKFLPRVGPPPRNVGV